ncbi:MAG: DUF2398 family protein [Acidimicrobiia bacterium]|nr:DUF2398 family protein [Acidimicrobiia bacterium]
MVERRAAGPGARRPRTALHRSGPPHHGDGGPGRAVARRPPDGPRPRPRRGLPPRRRPRRPRHPPGPDRPPRRLPARPGDRRDPRPPTTPASGRSDAGAGPATADGHDVDDPEEPADGATTVETARARPVPTVERARVDAEVDDLVRRYGRAFARELRDDPRTLTRHALDHLDAMGLVRVVGDVVAVRPPLFPVPDRGGRPRPRPARPLPRRAPAVSDPDRHDPPGPTPPGASHPNGVDVPGGPGAGVDDGASDRLGSGPDGGPNGGGTNGDGPDSRELVGRFRPTRAGIIGLWDYTHEEFAFAGGRLGAGGPRTGRARPRPSRSSSPCCSTPTSRPAGSTPSPARDAA